MPISALSNSEPLLDSLDDDQQSELQRLLSLSDDPDETRAHLQNATIYAELSGDRPEKVFDYTDAINETLYGNASHAAALAQTQKTADSVKKTLTERLKDFGLLDVLERLPFSKLHDFRKKFAAASKAKEETGKFPLTSFIGVSLRLNDWLGLLDDVTPEQRKKHLEFYEKETQRGQTIGTTIFDGVTMLPAYMMEFAMGGALAKAIGLPYKGVKGALAVSGVRTAVQPERVASALIDQTSREGQGPATSLFKAYGDVYIENLSETAGAAVGPILKKLPLGSRLMGAMSRLAAKAGIPKVKFLERISTQLGWNGLVGEWGEERLATELKAIFNVDDFGTGPDSSIADRMAAGFLADMTLSNQLAEAGVLSFPFATKMAISKLVGSKPIEIEEPALPTEVTEAAGKAVKAGVGEEKRVEVSATEEKRVRPGQIVSETDKARPKPAGKEAQELETPEEAKVAEAKLEAEAGEVLKPKLWIGNVTQGMKKRVAKSLGVDKKDIADFKEKGFLTNRTDIEMTRAEAEDYLSWLERDIVRRLEGNLVRTENDLAMLNADWGDVTNLRKVLEIPKGKAPFRVIRKKAHEIRVIPNIPKRIKEAIRQTDESKMTVGEVLSAVLRRSARFAKMAFVGGRRELRADIQAKARAKKRMNKAVKAIKRKVPKTVDIVYREAIEAVKATIDPSFRTKKTLKARESLREFIKRNPEQAKGIPAKKLEVLGKKPLNDYTIEELEDIAAEIERLKQLGGLRRRLEVSQEEKSKARDLEKLTAKGASVPVTKRAMLSAEKIGEQLSFTARAKNTLSKMINVAAAKWRSVAVPMDVFFDMLDGVKNYAGVNFKLFKQGLDTRYSKYLDLRDQTQADVVALAAELGLQDGNFERIGVFAALQQEGGREKLLDTGYTEEQIDEVELTPEERQLYDLMREELDALTDDIEGVMHDVYNQPLRRVKNYFSFMTDFDAMSEFELREMYGDNVIELSAALRKNVEKKFTITRRGGKQRIQINAMQVFLQHTDNASYLIEMASEIKRLSEIAATEEYGAAVGEVGQEEVRSWLDLMARKGRAQRGKTIPILDTFRKHSGAAVIGFKLSSALVNATPLLDGAGMIGRYAFTGASDVATSRQWREFITTNFAEIRDRMGGDIEFLEFGSSAIERAEKAGFWALQKIDGIAAASVAAGAYQKYLDDNGLKMNFNKPNQAAIDYAQLIMRRTQSSAFFKDLPSAFTRGTFTGNKSVDRLMFQFQSFILNRWSLIEHDMLRTGITTKNVSQGMNMFFWLAMAGFAEMALRRLSKEIVAMFTGQDLDDWEETFVKENTVNTLQNIPFISQGVSLYNYGSIPVPALSLVQRMGEKITMMKRTKDPDKKLLQTLELLVLMSGTALGVPGTMQASEIIRSVKSTKEQKRRPAGG